jgi:predicted Rossmann fold flavoprotein
MTVKTEDGRRFRGGAVVLAAGGQAAPKLGGGSSGYELARSLGHSVEPLRPCLTPLRCKGRFFKSLKGVRVLCRAALWAGGKRLAVEAGEIQFTDYGLSGIPALQFSCHFREGAQVSLDLLPGWEEKALEEELKRRLEAHSGEPLEDALLGLLARRVQYALLRELGLDPTAPARQVNARQRSQLLRGLKDWRIPVLGTQGWEQAQVSAGGVSLDEVQEDFSSVFEPRLFLAGEVLDVAGDCGGYNLHWAWCSGMEAGANAAKLCR